MQSNLFPELVSFFRRIQDYIFRHSYRNAFHRNKYYRNWSSETVLAAVYCAYS